MTRTRLLEALHQQPFVPFVLHLPDGRSVRVRHPEMALVPPVERTIVVWDDGVQFVDLLLISDITFGRDRRRRRSA